MKSIAQLERLLKGGRNSEESALYESGNAASQVIWVMCMFFIMAWIISLASAMSDAKAAKAAAATAMSRMEEIENTPQGEQFRKTEAALIELQRQKLLIAVEKCESDARARYGLATFSPRNTDGTMELRAGSVLSGSSLSPLFVDACRRAKESLPDQPKLREEWLARILLLSGLRQNDLGGQITTTFEVLTVDNQRWLFGEITRRIEGLYSDVRSMQRAAIASVCEFYQGNPEKVSDGKLAALLDRYPSAAPDKQREIFSLLISELVVFVKSEFHRQGVELLSDI